MFDSNLIPIFCAYAQEMRFWKVFALVIVMGFSGLIMWWRKWY